MNRLAGLGLLTFGLMAALLDAADDPAPEKPEPPVRLKKKDKPAAPAAKELAPEKSEPGVRLKKKDKGDAAKEGEQGPDEQTKELLARVAKNMETSEDRLKKADPSEKTRKVQDQIVKDLDELIKKAQQQQQQQQQQQSAGGGGGSSGKSGTAQAGSKSQRRISKRGTSQGSQQAKDSGSKPKPGEGLDKKGGDKKDEIAGADKKNGKDKLGKDGSASKDGGGGNSAQKRNTIADLQRTEKDIWGHLPEAKRQEMDAYARDRFMPKYDELLRQYYRTISEQNRKKDGD